MPQSTTTKYRKGEIEHRQFLTGEELRFYFLLSPNRGLCDFYNEQYLDKIES